MFPLTMCLQRGLKLNTTEIEKTLGNISSTLGQSYEGTLITQVIEKTA